MSEAASFDRQPLGELCVRGSVWNPQREPRERLTYVDVSAVSSERLSIVAPQELPAASAPSRARKIIAQGDTLFATIRPALRRIAFVPSELSGELASTAFCVIRPNPKKLLPEFADRKSTRLNSSH